jgi:prepilin-type N-terminal cleavage/methylation domain-containing protein
MILKRFRLIEKNQNGFTLIELLIVISITAIISAGIATAIILVITGNTQSSNHVIAVRQVQEAGYWVSHDAQMAQRTTINDAAATGFPVTLTWSNWKDNTSCEAVYSLVNMSGGLKQLQRVYSENGTIADSSIVSHNINISGNPPLTSCNITSDGIIIFNVSATVGTGSDESNESRTYEIIPKPSL